MCSHSKLIRGLVEDKGLAEDAHRGTGSYDMDTKI